MHKVRLTEAGVHLFDRASGLNILIDDLPVPTGQLSTAPRFISVALTNACSLRCAFCYAPKHAAALQPDRVVAWAVELDQSGCLGIGFGGGEPTAHPHFADLCNRITASTAMAVTFTTHGHRITPKLVEALRGFVHFARLSVDGIGDTYERVRNRPFRSVVAAATLLRSIAPIGINMVVNPETIGDLDRVAEFAAEVGASELLLLPAEPTEATDGITAADADRLVRWICTSKPPIRLTISRSGLEAALPCVDPISGEHPLDAHMHIDASGVLRRDAYSSTGTYVDGSILDAIQILRETA